MKTTFPQFLQRSLGLLFCAGATAAVAAGPGGTIEPNYRDAAFGNSSQLGSFSCHSTLQSTRSDKTYPAEVAGSFSHGFGFGGDRVTVSVGEVYGASYNLPTGGVYALGSVLISARKNGEALTVRYFGEGDPKNLMRVEVQSYRGWASVESHDVACSFSDSNPFM